MDKRSNKIKKEYMDIVNSYVKRLINEKVPFEAVYVFGSTVKGTDHKWSDIDTCVVSDLFGKDPISEGVFLMGKARGISNLIEPHPFSPLDFNDKYNPLANEIKKTGIKVY